MPHAHQSDVHARTYALTLGEQMHNRTHMPTRTRAFTRTQPADSRSQVTCKAGQVALSVKCRPAIDFARRKHTVEIDEKGAVFRCAEPEHAMSMRLMSSVALQADGDAAVCSFELAEGEQHVFYLGGVLEEFPPVPDDGAYAKVFQNTLDFWHGWIRKCSYTGRWREMVYRSALVMKLLTFEETGAIVAAGTTSLPEKLGGSRNWDYRYMWIRDAAFTLYGFIRIGFTEEAEDFMLFLEKILAKSKDMIDSKNGPLQIMYKINGDLEINEEVLTHLDGYKGSKPVRVGNFAFGQLQLDIYGELMDSVYLYNKYGSPVSYQMWEHCRMMVDWVCDNWTRPDEGIWEMRSGRQHYVYSKVMCWVAVDRGLRLADRRSFPAPREKWLRVRDQIYEEIMTKGWSDTRKAFVQHYGSEHLDAANLIMPLVLYLSASDPKFLSTLEAVSKPGKHGGLVRNSLIARYDTTLINDAIDQEEEGTFNICSFWYIECLTRVRGAAKGKFANDAVLRFEDMLSYANHVGLFSEETSADGMSSPFRPLHVNHRWLHTCLL
eukprot:TRINITY_DN4128_c0_g1_i1.p1 TRINITY_DN4128_c0_g1~~TRINITY_DN4128_c0_g1_i1.p1  ORF type:complete len:548 (-),score=155.78 TRINITY_DN4128_c0_g1_i1:246-1889(-)